MSAAAYTVVPDPREGKPAYDAVVLVDGHVLDKRRFERREEAERWARGRTLSFLSACESQLDLLADAGYSVLVVPAGGGVSASALVEGRVVALGRGETADEALAALMGELGLEARR